MAPLSNPPAHLSLIVVSRGTADADDLLKVLAGHGPDTGFEVATSSDVPVVADTMKQSGADAVLYVPDWGGDVAVQHVRALHTANPRIPVLVVAADDDRALAVSCIDGGAQDCLFRRDVEPILVRRAIAYARARRREVEREEVERLLTWYNGLSGAAAATTVTRQSAQARDRAFNDRPQMDRLDGAYAALFAQYMDALAVHKEKPRRAMLELATQLGDMGASPRDLIDVHLAALSRLSQQATAQRTSALSVNGRLLALEMMGHLVDYYRIGVRTPPADPDAQCID